MGALCSDLACACGSKSTGKWLFYEFVPQIWVPDVARVLIGLNNKNLDSDIGVNTER